MYVAYHHSRDHNHPPIIGDEEEKKLEEVPLTPRGGPTSSFGNDGDDENDDSGGNGVDDDENVVTFAPSEESSSPSSTRSGRSSGYLSLFRSTSPAPPASVIAVGASTAATSRFRSRHFPETFSVDNRTRTPLFALPERRRRFHDDDDDENDARDSDGESDETNEEQKRSSLERSPSERDDGGKPTGRRARAVRGDHRDRSDRSARRQEEHEASVEPVVVGAPATSSPRSIGDSGRTGDGISDGESSYPEIRSAMPLSVAPTAPEEDDGEFHDRRSPAASVSPSSSTVHSWSESCGGSSSYFQPDISSMSVLSSASHLLGESLVSLDGAGLGGGTGRGRAPNGGQRRHRREHDPVDVERGDGGFARGTSSPGRLCRSPNISTSLRGVGSGDSSDGRRGQQEQQQHHHHHQWEERPGELRHVRSRQGERWWWLGPLRVLQGRGAGEGYHNNDPVDYAGMLQRQLQRLRNGAAGRRRRAQLSPRSRNLADLHYLTQQHRAKVEQMGIARVVMAGQEQPGVGGESLAQQEAHEHYDFCLVLQPQEVYAFWAALLDFRVEMLGPEVVEAMESNWATSVDQNRIPLSSGEDTYSPSSSTSHSTRSSTGESEDDDDHHSDEALDSFESLVTPSAAVCRRRGSGRSLTPAPGRRGIQSAKSSSARLSSSAPRLTAPFSSRRSLISPGMYSVAAESCSRISTQSARLSLFERAVGASATATPQCPPPIALNRSSDLQSLSRRNLLTEVSGNDRSNRNNSNNNITDTATTPATLTSSRRRWGNHTAGATPNMMSPPIRSLTRGSTMVRRPTVMRTAQNAGQQQGVGDCVNGGSDPNVIRMEDIPNQVIPRGIAARTNGMLQFLSVLRRGFVLRRHKPGQEAAFCKIISHDGGDTIHYEFMERDDAMIAFKEQRVRYNTARATTAATVGESSVAGPPVAVEAQPWSVSEDHSDQDETSMARNFSVPDYVAAKQYREQMIKEQGLGRKVNDLACKVVRSGFLKAADIIAVHPASHGDPRSDTGEQATHTLRRSKSEFSANHSFSLVTRLGQRFAVGNISTASLDQYESKWYKGEGSEAQYRYLDFEAATLGEYWLVFRGFLLLHRDAAVGRFAEHRAAGIGSHYSRLELEQRATEQEDLANGQDRLHRDEFHEPVTVGCLEKLIVELRDLDRTYMEGFTLPGAVPPPSDYFLGFRSPGTAIWSRLRQAGLETQRVYSLDPRRVMIKVRCPSDRLMDVCEVLRLKLVTRDGSFAPFRESMIDYFRPLDDPLELPQIYRSSPFPFRSSTRQTIIDFIIGSRIRDSGAELGQTTDLGKMVQAGVPLHMHAKLEAIYQSWVFYWKVENWQNGRDGRSMTHRSQHHNSPLSSLMQQEKEGEVDYGNGTECKTPGGGIDGDDNRTDGASADHDVPGFLKRFFMGCLHQPLDSIEQYFGEKVAFYFAWLQHTAAHLVFLTIAGVIVFICQLASRDWDHPLRPFYAMVVMLWTFIVLINWRKRANFLAYRWGTMNYKEQETTRPQFRGDYARDEITGEWVVTYPKWKRWLKYTISFPLTLLFTTVSLMIILWVHANRDLQLARYLEQKTDPNSEEFQFEFAFSAIGKKAPIAEVELTRNHLCDINFWFIVVGMPSLLGLFLPLLNFVLMRLSIMLTDFENYRTESEYRTHLIIKVFSFRFVCYFATLYYYAFVSVGNKQAVENGILRVGTGVLVYITVAHWWQIFLHVYFPLLIRMLRMRHRRNRLRSELRDIELEEEELDRTALISINRVHKEVRKRQIRLINKRLLLEQAQDETWLEIMRPPHDSFPEYIQAVVQFTYVSCFSVVLPITPLICLFNYLLSMRLDAYKLCRGRRRPLAEKTGGIGVWEHLLHIVSVVSILTNCWLMGFTNSQFTWIADQVGDLGLFAIVVGWEHVMLLIKYVMSISISPLPKSVKDATKREQYELDRQRYSTMRQRRRSQRKREEEEEEEEDWTAALLDCNEDDDMAVEDDGSGHVKDRDGDGADARLIGEGGAGTARPTETTADDVRRLGLLPRHDTPVLRETGGGRTRGHRKEDDNDDGLEEENRPKRQQSRTLPPTHTKMMDGTTTPSSSHQRPTIGTVHAVSSATTPLTAKRQATRSVRSLYSA